MTTKVDKNTRYTDKKYASPITICAACITEDKQLCPLHAAAADLLEACKELEMRLSLARISLAHMADQGGVDNMPVPLFLKKVREAIAKAEGKE